MAFTVSYQEGQESIQDQLLLLSSVFIPYFIKIDCFKTTLQGAKNQDPFEPQRLTSGKGNDIVQTSEELPIGQKPGV